MGGYKNSKLFSFSVCAPNYFSEANSEPLHVSGGTGGRSLIFEMGWKAHFYPGQMQVAGTFISLWTVLFVFFFLISEEFSNLSLEIRMYFQSCLGRSMEKYMYKVYFETCKNYIRHLYYTDVIMFLLTIKTMKIRKINVKNF